MLARSRSRNRARFWGGSGGSPSPPYDPDAQAFFDACVTEPSGGAKTAINDLVVSLKADSLWNNIDALWPLCMEDSQAGRLELKNPGSFTAAEVASPTFTAKFGWAGNGSSSYLDTGWTPSTHASALTRNSAFIGVFIDAGTDTANNFAAAAGVRTDTNRELSVIPRAVNNFIRGGVTGSRSSTSGTVATRQGFTVLERTPSTTVTSYRNGSVVGTYTNSSTGLPSASLFAGCIRDGASPGLFSNNRFSCLVVGGALGATDQGKLYTHILAFRTAMGALA